MLFTASLRDILRKHNVQFHWYYTSNAARNIGLIFDETVLKMFEKQIAAMHLQDVRFSTFDKLPLIEDFYLMKAHLHVHEFVKCTLDTCHNLIHGRTLSENFK